jgi:hypothetical protein
MKPLDFVVKYWVVLVFSVSGISTVAIGGQKIKNFEEALKKQIIQNEEVQEMKVEQKVLVERTKTIVKSLDKQEENMKLQQEVLIKILLKLEQPE